MRVRDEERVDLEVESGGEVDVRRPNVLGVSLHPRDQPHLQIVVGSAVRAGQQEILIVSVQFLAVSAEVEEEAMIVEGQVYLVPLICSAPPKTVTP